MSNEKRPGKAGLIHKERENRTPDKERKIYEKGLQKGD